MCDYHKKMYNSIQSKFWKKEKDDSKLIRYFINGKRYEDAINIIKKHPNNFLIQSQLITIYIEKKDYEKAIDIARRFPSNKIIQSQLMTIYIKREEYEKALEIAEKFSSNTPIQSQLITIYIEKKDYEKAIDIARRFPSNKIIQSQLMTIYIKREEYEKALEIARRFPSDKIIQSQLMTIYIKREEYEKALEIAKRFPYYAQIQSQLMTIYIEKQDYEKVIEIAKRFPSNKIIQNQLNILTNDEDKAVIIDKDLFKMDTVLSEELKFPKEIFEIRSKISLGNISTKDLSTLESLKEQIDYEKYLLIKLAIYEKLNLSNMGIKLLKQDTSLDDRLRKQLVMQFERKNKIYNLEKWDDLIGWFNDLNFDVLTNDCLQDSDIKMVTDDLLPKNDSNVHQIKNNSKSKIKKGTKSNRKVIEIPSSKTNLEKTKKKTIKESKNKTLDDMLNQVYKEIVLKLKIKYYIEMHDEKTKKSAMYKYDRLEEVLAGDANIRNFELLLLMLVGDGGNSLGIEQSVPDKYNDEYTKVLRKINSRSHRKY